MKQGKTKKRFKNGKRDRRLDPDYKEEQLSFDLFTPVVMDLFDSLETDALSCSCNASGQCEH